MDETEDVSPCSCFQFSPRHATKRNGCHHMSNFDDHDPLTVAMAPPFDEAPEQRHARELAEAEAKRISDEIDEQIRKEKEGEKKKKKPVKLLLLGQHFQIVASYLISYTFRSERERKDCHTKKCLLVFQFHQ